MSLASLPWSLPPLVLREGERVEGVALDEAELCALRASPLVTVAPGWEAGRFTLTARPLVGRAALPRRWLVVQPKLPLANVFAMLAATAGQPRLAEAATGHAAGEDALAGLAALFARALVDYLDHGARRGSVALVEAAPFVRGKLLLGPTLRQPPARRHLPVTRRQVWSLDTPLHRLLKQAATLALTLVETRHAVETRHVASLLDMALACLASVTDTQASEAAFDAVTLTRLDAPAAPAFALARWLIAGHAPHLDSGRRAFPAFSLDMARLFETCVARLVADAVPDARVAAQRAAPLDQGRRVWLRPDLVIWRAGRAILVLDAKYKTPGEPDPADLYQLATYCHTLGARRGILVYPAPVTTAPLRLHGGDVTLHSVGLDLGVAPVDFPAARDSFAQTVRHLATA